MDGALENFILDRNFQSRSKSRIFLIFGPSGNNREMVKAEVFEKKGVRTNGPIKMKKMKGAFSLNNLLVGTVWPPDHGNIGRN